MPPRSPCVYRRGQNTDVATPGSRTAGSVPLAGHRPEEVTQEERRGFGKQPAVFPPCPPRPECLSLRGWINHTAACFRNGALDGG